MLIRPGLSSTAVFFSTTFPVTGLYNSEAAFTLSKAPHSSEIETEKKGKSEFEKAVIGKLLHRSHLQTFLGYILTNIRELSINNITQGVLKPVTTEC